MGAGSQTLRIGKVADPDSVCPQALNPACGVSLTCNLEAHQAAGWRCVQQRCDAFNVLQSSPHSRAFGADCCQPLIGRALLLQQIEGTAQASQKRHAAGGHLKAAAVGVERSAGRQIRFALIPQASPADQCGLPFAQHPLGKSYATKSFRAAGPYCWYVYHC